VVSRTLRTKLRRDLRRQWPQLAAVTVTVLLGVALFGASYDAYLNLNASYDKVFTDQRFADLWITGGQTATLAEQARHTPGVASVTTRVQVDVPLQVGPDKLRGRVIGIPAGSQPAIDGVSVLAGHYPTGPDDGVLVEHHMADHFRLHPGDTVAILSPGGWRSVRVAGVVASGEYLWPARSRQEPITVPDQFGVLFAPEPLATQAAGTGRNQVLVRLDRGAPGGTLDTLRRIAMSAGAADVVTRDQQPSNSLLHEDINGFSELSYLFPLLFLTAAGLATYILLTRRVQAEQPIIGTMLAAGIPRAQVLRHYLGYGLVTGTAGAVLGVVTGAVAARTLSRLYLQAIGLPPGSAVIAALHPATAATGLGFGIIAGLLAAYGPARHAARIPPAQAMRGTVPTAAGRTSLLERLIPPLRRLPARWRYVLRGIGRNRRRTAFTALGTVLALLLILTSWTMIDTMNAAMRTQFDTVQKQDARVDFTGPATPVELAAIAAVPGVAAVEPMTELPVTLSAADHSYATAVVALPQHTTMHGFRLPGGSTTSLPSQGILVGQAIHDQLHVTTGDTITARVGDAAPVQARIAGLLDEPMGTYAYISTDQLRAQAPDAPVTSALLRLEPGGDRDTVRRAVTALPAVAAYQDSKALSRLYQQFTGLFYTFIAAMLALGALMAFAIIFTTMSVNILERQREMATLRIGGVPQRTVARILTGENLLLTLLGVVPGLVLGVLGGRAFLATYTNDQLRLELAIRPVTLVASAAAILAVAVLSQRPGLRAIARLDLASTVRERAG
jgi:putative ABC transport system permease protein